MIVPGVPTTIWHVNLGIPRLTESRPAWKHSTGVYSPIRSTTDMICSASSREGAMQMACQELVQYLKTCFRGSACVPAAA